MPYTDVDKDFFVSTIGEATPYGAKWITIVHAPSGVSITSSRFSGAHKPVIDMLRKHALEIANALKQESHDLQNLQRPARSG